MRGEHAGGEQRGHQAAQQGRGLQRHAPDVADRNAYQHFPFRARYGVEEGAHIDAVERAAFVDAGHGGVEALLDLGAGRLADEAFGMARAGQHHALAVDQGHDPVAAKMLARQQRLQGRRVDADQQVIADGAVDHHRDLDRIVRPFADRSVEQVRDQGRARAGAAHQFADIRAAPLRQIGAEGTPCVDQLAAVQVCQHDGGLVVRRDAPGVGMELCQVPGTQRIGIRQRVQDPGMAPQFMIDEQCEAAGGVGHVLHLCLLFLAIDVGHGQGCRDKRWYQDGQHEDQEASADTHERTTNVFR